MIRKILALSVFIMVLSGSSLYAQCTPDTAITQPGIYPDSATGLPPAYLGTPYSEVVQARIPVDTIFQGNLVPITNFTISSLSGLPPGFSYACNPGTCIFPGGSNGCILISGNPAATGTFTLTVNGIANGLIAGIPAQLPFTLDYYKIIINPASGVPQNVNYTFSVAQNEPNPFATSSDINFTSPIAGKAELKIYNMIGKEVYQGTYRMVNGKNVIRLDAEDFDSGVYMYTLNLENKVFTKRMIVSKK